MHFGYVVLYVNNSEECLKFWTEQVGMVEKGRNQFGEFSIYKVGFADEQAALELVPLDLMKDNPDGLDLATPSMAFRVPNLEAAHAALKSRGVQVIDIAEHSGMQSFAFCDNENRWFAVILD